MTQLGTISGTEVHLVHSEVMGFDYEVTVQMPAVPIDGPWPVAFSTDANPLLGVTCCAFSQLQMNGEMPPVLNVNIGYPVGGDLAFVLARRPFEFTTTDNEILLRAFNTMVEATGSGQVARSGGADLFCQFLEEELWPWVAGNYDVVADRTYVGNSLAAYFGLYQMFARPGFFQRFVLGSPWLAWDLGVIQTAEENFARANDDLAATVFVSVGDSEDFVTAAMDPAMAGAFKKARMAERNRELCKKLEARGYPSLRLKHREFSEQTHNMSPFTSIPHGLKYVFS